MTSAPERPRQPRSARLLESLLVLLPADFRDRFGAEMKEQLQNELAQGGFLPSIRLLVDILGAVLRERCDQLRMDLHFGLRTLAKRPLFTLTTIVSLSVGIGATVTVVSVLQAAFHREIEGLESAGLVNINPRLPLSEGTELISYPEFRQLRDHNRSLSGLAGFHGSRLSWTMASEPEIMPAQLVSSNYFSVLGVELQRGRFFSAEEEQQETPVAVISSWFWRHRLGSDQAVLGRQLVLNGTSFTVVGVAAEGFRGHFVGFTFDLFLPTSMSPLVGHGAISEPHTRWVELVGRLGSETDITTAQADFELLANLLASESPEHNEGLKISVEPNRGIDADLRGGLLAFLTALLIISGIVLVIACVNVANMMLGHMVRRRREMAVRQSLGAARSRLLRQVMTEGLLLAGGATMLGIGAAMVGLQLIETQIPTIAPGLGLELQLDSATVLIAISVALGATLLFAGAPARSFSKRDLQDQLGGRTEVASISRFRRALIVAQVTLSAVILMTGGMFLRTLTKVASLDPGFELDGVYVTGIRPQLIALEQDVAIRLLEDIQRRASAAAGLTSAGLTSRLPLSLGARFFANAVSVELLGQEDPVPIEHASISPGFLETMGISLRRGRGLTPADRSDSQPVALVNQTFVDRYFSDREVLGVELRADDREVRIVGVVEDSRYRRLDEEQLPFLYLALSQGEARSAALVAKAAAGPGSATETIRSIVHEVEPHLPVATVSSLRRSLEAAFLPQRIGSVIAATLGIVGLFLSAIGVYGVLAYSVHRRTAEIGVRLSLGARPAHVLRSVLGEGLVYSLVGAVLAVPLAYLCADLLRVFLIGPSRFDLIVYLGMSALLVLTSLIASWVPARRAMRIDPLEAFRQL